MALTDDEKSDIIHRSMVAPQTLDRLLTGQTVRRSSRTRIEQAAKELGINVRKLGTAARKSRP